MVTIPKLEMHITDACNLRCAGCTHYADHGLRGRLELSVATQWIAEWSRRVSPLRFSLLGGEPLLHRDVPRFLVVVRETWPGAELRLVTNGLLLARHPELWPVLASTSAILTVSEHARTPEYAERFAPALRLARERASDFGVRLDVRDCVTGWFKLYRGAGPAMRPFEDGDARRSWRVCETKHCLTLRDNALWKCPPVAHLPVVAAMHGLAAEGSWRPYLAYEPLELSATDDEIRGFVGRREEPVCEMCPVNLRSFEKSVTGGPAPW